MSQHDGESRRDLPIRCPRCGHDTARLFVNSYSVVTLQCASCLHTWATPIDDLPDAVRVMLPRTTPRRSGTPSA